MVGYPTGYSLAVGAECRVEVVDEVVGVLDADGQPDEVAGTSSGVPETDAWVIRPGAR